MANGVVELIDMLYNMVSDAWGLPLGAEKCVVERDKVLDLLDEIKAQLPTEIAEAKRLVSARSDYIANARKEAESIKKMAEDHARRLIDEQSIVQAAKARSTDIISRAEAKAMELRRVANGYADDTLKRTEDAISEALDEIHQSRVRFHAAVNTQHAEPVVSEVEDENM